MKKRAVLLAAFVAVVLIAIVALITDFGGRAEASTPRDQWSLDGAGVAIAGYSPVSYFQHGKAEKGSSDFRVEHQGIAYYLTDEEQVALFNESPDRYQPAHGGWCTLMLAGSGNRVPANPEVFRVIDDRLFMVFHGSWGEAYVDGNALWEEKGGPAAIEHADEVWEAVRAGKKRSKILRP